MKKCLIVLFMLVFFSATASAEEVCIENVDMTDCLLTTCSNVDDSGTSAWYVVDGTRVDCGSVFSQECVDTAVELCNGGGGGGGGGSTPSPGLGNDSLQGSYSFSINGDQITFSIDEIANTSSEDSGSIRIEFYATDRPYMGGGISGYSIGEYSLDTLGSGTSYHDVDRTISYDEPPAGRYYITMLLLEDENGTYGIADYGTFSEPVTVESSSSSLLDELSSGSGGGCFIHQLLK